MRDDRVSIWQQNVEKRKAGKGAESTEQGVSINKDYPLTKAKIAQLSSQQPEIRLSPRHPVFAPAVHDFGLELNTILTESGANATVQEELADVVNASGIGGCLVSCEALTEMRFDEVTGMDAPFPTDRQYLASRVSPPDILIPSDFTGSDYNQCRWLGREGRMTPVEAQRVLGLTEEQLTEALGGDKRTSNTNSTLNTDSNKFRDNKGVVTFQELFYWRHFYHPEETRYKAIQHRVFVDGIEAPVLDEPYRGQKALPDGTLVGVLELPLLILTLTYISDEALPPSDSTIGRYCVDELETSRTQIGLQRKHSIPRLWFDTGRLGPNGRVLLENDEYLGAIPIQGPGDRAIGQIQTGAYPPEKYELDRIIGSDLSEIWQVGANQTNSFSEGEHSATEARVIQQNFQTRIGQERDRVTKHWLAIARVMAGHMALYGQFQLPEGIQPESIANGFIYSVRVDSTVLLDSHQQIEQIKDYVNMWGQSGTANLLVLARKHAELLGWNPEEVTVPPQPKAPEPVKISIGSAEDIINPLMLAALSRTNQLPTPQDVTAVAALLAAIESNPSMAAQMVPPEPAEDGQPAQIEAPGIAHPDMQEQPRINKRDQDGGA